MIERSVPAIAAAMLVAACGGQANSENPTPGTAQVRAVSGVAGYLEGGVWLHADQIIYDLDPNNYTDGNLRSSQVWETDSLGTNRRLLNAPGLVGCRITDYRGLTIVNSTTVGLIATCHEGEAPKTQVLVGDISTDTWSWFGAATTDAIANPTWLNAAEGFLVDDPNAGNCPGIGIVTRHGVSRFDLDLSTGSGNWNIGGSFGARGGNCADGRARMSSTSTLGQLAFLGSPPAITQRGVSGTTAWTIYATSQPGIPSPGTNTVRRGNSYELPSALALSPDGRFVAVAGSFEGDVALWVESNSGELPIPTRVLSGTVDQVTWSPDGAALLAIEADTSNPVVKHAVIVSMPTLMLNRPA